MSEILTFYLVRHGETLMNREGIFRGRIDAPLNEAGMKQGVELGKALSHIKFDAIYSSPLARSLATASAIMTANPDNPPVEINESFNNINLGEWQGEPKDVIAAKYPKLWQKWVYDPENIEIPGAETFKDIKNRLKAALDEIIKTHNGNIAIVSHRSILKTLLALFIGLEGPYFWHFHLDNASYSTVEYSEDRGFTITHLNVSHYLTDYVQERV
ncbi:MAG: histidine phosphatase family protein [Candidatus Zixiibacteriota bacterium]